MKKFFKFGNKKGSSPTHNVHRRSLGSFASAGSGEETPLSSGWGSFVGLNFHLEERGYPIDLAKDKTLTKLHRACWTGDLDKVKKHIHKVDVNHIDSEYRTPLHLAAVQAHKDVIWFLLGYKAKPNLRDSDGNTPLLKAVQCHHGDIVQFLLERGADPKCSNNNDDTGLHVVASDGLQDIAFSLIHKGANVNAQNKAGMTPLMVATIERRLEMAELFLRHDASVNICNKNQKNCLMLACEDGLAEFVQIFLLHGVDVSLKNDVNLTAEDIASVSGHEDCAAVIRAYRLGQNLIEMDADSSDLKMPESYDILSAITASNAAVLFHNEEDAAAPSRASQVELDADFSGGELDSWNDVSIESPAPQKQVAARNINLTMFLSATNAIPSPQTDEYDGKNNTSNSDKQLDSNNLGIQANEEEKATSMMNDSDYDFHKDANDPTANILPKNSLHLDKDIMQELGLSDVSEVTTPSYSEPSLKKGQSKADDTDVEDKGFNDSDSNSFQQAQEMFGTKKEVAVFESVSNPLENSESQRQQLNLQPDNETCAIDNRISAVELQPQDSDNNSSNVSSHISVPNNSYTQKKLDSARSSENVQCDNHSVKNDILYSSQHTDVQSHNVSAKKDKIFVGVDSGSDWDEDSRDDDTGTIHMHPVILRKLSDKRNESVVSTANTQEDMLNVSKVKSDAAYEAKLSDNLPSQQSHGRGNAVKVQLKAGSKMTRPLSPLKKMTSSIMLREGTLGRHGTMHEIEEIWESNPCVEVSDMLDGGRPESDVVHHGKLVGMECSEEESKLLTLEAKPVALNGLENDNEFLEDKAKLWEQLWIQICGISGPENYTESDEEISASVPLTDEENKDGGYIKEATFQEISSTDDQSSLSLQGDQQYKLLAYVLKDPVNIGRVIDMVQHLRLAWQKAQDKSKVLNQKVAHLKSEIEKSKHKTLSLNADRVETVNRLSQVEAELESLNHVLSSERGQRLELELTLEHSKSELKSLEERLVQELTARQQAELAIKAAQDEVKNLQDLLKSQTSITGACQPSVIDADCQTSETGEGDCTDKNVSTENDEKLENELTVLQQKADYLSSINAEEKLIRVKTEEQVITLQQQLTECQQNLTSYLTELKIIEVEKETLMQKADDLKQENKDLSSKNVATEQQNGQLSVELTTLKCSLEENCVKISLLQAESEILKDNEIKLKTELKASERVSEQLTFTVKDLQNKLTEMQSDYLTMKLRLESTSKMNLMLEQTETSLQGKWEQTCASLHENYEKSKKILMEHNQALIENKNVLQMELCELQKRTGELESELQLAEHLKAQLSNQLEKAQEYSDHKDQVIKSLEEKHLIAVNSGQDLLQQIEEYHEKEMLHKRDVTLLEEKQRQLDALTGQVSRLETQLSLARDDAFLAEKKVKELERRHQAEGDVLAELSTLEVELAEARVQLHQADATIDQMSNKVASQEKEVAGQRKLLNEFDVTVERLSQAEKRIHELNSELLKKDTLLEELVIKFELSPDTVTNLRPLGLNFTTNDKNPYKSVRDVLQEDEQMKCYRSFNLQERPSENNECGSRTFTFNGHHNDMLMSHERNPNVEVYSSAPSQNLYQDCGIAPSKLVHPILIDKPRSSKYWDLQDVVEGNASLMHTDPNNESMSKLSQLEKVLCELQDEVGVLKNQSLRPRNEENPAISPAASMEFPKQVISLEDLQRQVELLGNELKEEKKMREANESHRNQLEQQLLEVTNLLKHTRRLHKIKASLDENVNGDGGYNRHNLDLTKQQWEVEARLELNQQMEQINKFLEERSRVSDHLEHLHNERESRMHLEYQHVVRALQLEVRQLSDRLQEREAHQRALDEQYHHLHELSDARKRVKVKLNDCAGLKRHSKYTFRPSPSRPKNKGAFESSSFDYATGSTSTNVVSPSLSSSPIINNLRSSKGFGNSAAYKFTDRRFARHLSSGPKNEFEGYSCHRNFNNIALARDKSTTGYLNSLKHSYPT